MKASPALVITSLNRGCALAPRHLEASLPAARPVGRQGPTLSHRGAPLGGPFQPPHACLKQSSSTLDFLIRLPPSLPSSFSFFFK